MDPDDIHAAIIAQESGGNPNVRTSSDNAVGIGQITPGTFKQYAQPGENLYNPKDNFNVSKRIIKDYYDRYNGDPGRIATAYFSGPGNVAPPNSPVPYIRDIADQHGRGKQTSAYVADISKRLASMPDNKFDPDAAFSQWEKSANSGSVAKFDTDAAFSQWETGSGKQTTPSNVISQTHITPPSLMTPQQRAEQAIAAERGKQSYGISQKIISDNYSPLTANLASGTEQIGQGISQLFQNAPASGVGNVGMGLLNIASSPFTEATRFMGNVIGNPQAAEVASLVVPSKGATSIAKATLPSTRAASGLINLIGAENVPNVLQRLQNNPNLSLMDVSEPVRTVAAGLANKPDIPAAQNIMRGAYEARTAARQDIVKQAVEKTLGPPINVKDMTEQLSQNLRSVGDQMIKPALANAGPVPLKPILESLDAQIASPMITEATRNRLSDFRKALGKQGDEIDANKLHNMQWPLRAEAENLASSAAGTDRNMAGPLRDLRNNMVEAIDQAAGGQYKPALSQYRDAARVPEAFEKGFNIMKKGGAEDFPEHWQAWAKDASPQEIMAARVGAISQIRQTIGGMQSGARRGESMLRPEFIQERFNTIFPPEHVKQLSSLLEDAGNMNETNALLYRNSKTAQVTAGQQHFQPREVGKPAGAATGIGAGLAGIMATAAGHPEAGLAAGLFGAAKIAHTGLQYLGNLADKSTATKFARLASAGSGPARNELMDILRTAQSVGGKNKLGNVTPSLVRLAAP